MSRIFFGIPLIGMHASNNWARVSDILDATLRGIIGQTYKDIDIIVACNDIPENAAPIDDRIQFITLIDRRPSSALEQDADKRLKIRALFDEVYRQGGGYLVLMDADDFVCRTLAEHIRLDDNGRGYIIRNGYSLEPSRGRFYKLDKFDKRCGSCAVFYVNPSEDVSAGGYINSVILAGHGKYAEISEQFDRPLDEIPFPAMIYLRHHSESMNVRRRSKYQLTGIRNSLLRIIYRMLPSKSLPSDIRKAFVLPDAFTR